MFSVNHTLPPPPPLENLNKNTLNVQDILTEKRLVPGHYMSVLTGDARKSSRSLRYIRHINPFMPRRRLLGRFLSDDQMKKLQNRTTFNFSRKNIQKRGHEWVNAQSHNRIAFSVSSFYCIHLFH